MASRSGLENKVPFVAALTPVTGATLRVKLTPVSGFNLVAIDQWAQTHLAPGSTVF